MTNVTPVSPLICKQTHRVAGREVDFELQKTLHRNCLQIVVRVPKHEVGRFAFLVLFWQEPRKYTAEIEAHRVFPEVKFQNQALSSRGVSKRNENLAPEAFHPSVFNGAEAVRIRAFFFKFAHQRLVDPFRFFFHGTADLNGFFKLRERLNRLLPLSSGALQSRFLQFYRVLRIQLPIMQQVTVRVPASTSNLGPGFDCLGVALRLYNSVTILRGIKHSSTGVVDETARRFFKQTGSKSFPFHCVIEQGVPRSRGLGSSATLRAGVLLALNRLAGSPLDQFSIFRLCAELEGHSDNAAPAIFGGFTVVRGDMVQRFKVSARLHFVLLLPDLEIKTSVARKALPSQIVRAKAVESCANACAITAAFASRNYRGLRGAFTDHFHQPFRRKLIPFLPRVMRAAERAGALGAFLSGSGSAIAALTLQSPKKVAAEMLRGAKLKGARTIILSADNEGARYLKDNDLLFNRKAP